MNLKNESKSQNSNVENPENEQGDKCASETQCVTNVCCCCGHDHHDEHHKHEKKIGYSYQKVIETCTFDIYMTRILVIENKLIDGKAELMITGYANGQSAVFPGLGCWFVVSEKWGWVNINKRITSITFEKGTTRMVGISADAIEAEGFLGGKWELGSTQDYPFLQLVCGQQTGAVYVHVDIHRPGIFAGDTCKIKIEFMAFQVTP